MRRSLDPSEYFDPGTLASLRSLRRDRTLTIGGGARPWSDPGAEADGPGFEFVAWIDVGTGDVLAASPVAAEDRGEALIELLLQAILEPEHSGRPRLPRHVLVEEQSIAQLVEPSLRRLGVAVAVARVSALDTIVEAIRTAVAEIPAWARDTAAGLAIHQAAAALWAAAPWETLPDAGATATIELGEPVSSRMHATAVGLDSLAAVLFFLTDEDFLRMAEQGRNAEDHDLSAGIEDLASLRDYNLLMVVFHDANAGENDELDQEEMEHAAEMRWPIGSGSAYPRFIRTGDGEEIRGISDGEAQLLTLAMEGLARFCFREDVRSAQGESPISAEVRVRDGDELIAATVTSPSCLEHPLKSGLTSP